MINRKFYHCSIMLIFSSLLLIFQIACGRVQIKKQAQRPAPDQDVTGKTRAQPMPWLHQPDSLWSIDFTGSDRDDTLALPDVRLVNEGIGKKTRVHNLFDRWRLNQEIRDKRGIHYAEVTEECKGKIELDFAMTAEAWEKPENQVQYYCAIHDLIEKIGERLIKDFGHQIKGEEKRLFIQALKTLAWQESQWQHYLRYKDWFFVIVSGGSYNKLDDWGITQIARSSFDSNILLNENYFDSKAYCSISSALYYGFMEYYFCYMEARENPRNGASLMNKIVGAYNRYSSGYSSCCFDLAETDEAYRNYQIRAMGSFKDKFVLSPWEKMMIIGNE